MTSVLCMRTAYLTELIVRDFIESWYTESKYTVGWIVWCTLHNLGLLYWNTDISEQPKDEKFPNYVRYAVANAMGAVCYNASKRNTLVSLLATVSRALQYHLHWFTIMRDRARKKRPELFTDDIAFNDYERAGLTHTQEICGIEEESSPDGQSEKSSHISSVSSQLHGQHSANSNDSTTADNVSGSFEAFGSEASAKKTTDTNSEVNSSIAKVRGRHIDQDKQIRRQKLVMNEFASTNVLHISCNAHDAGCLGSSSGELAKRNSEKKQMDYVRDITSQLLVHLLPARETSSNAVHLIVCEVLSSCVINPLINVIRPSVCVHAFLTFLRSGGYTARDKDSKRGDTGIAAESSTSGSRENGSSRKKRASMDSLEQPKSRVFDSLVFLGKVDQAVIKDELSNCPPGTFAVWESTDPGRTGVPDGEYFVSILASFRGINRKRTLSDPSSSSKSTRIQPIRRPRKVYHIRLERDAKSNLFLIPRSCLSVLRSSLPGPEPVCSVESLGSEHVTLVAACKYYPQVFKQYLSNDSGGSVSSFSRFTLKDVPVEAEANGRTRASSVDLHPMYRSKAERKRDRKHFLDWELPPRRADLVWFLPICWSFDDLTNTRLKLLKSRYHPRNPTHSLRCLNVKLGMKNKGRKFVPIQAQLETKFAQVPYRRELIQKGILLPRLPRLAATVVSVRAKIPPKEQGILPTAVAFYEVRVKAAFVELGLVDASGRVDEVPTHVVQWTKWIRYREFFNLHNRMKECCSSSRSNMFFGTSETHWLERRYSPIRKLFPPKQVQIFSNSDEVIRQRQITLNFWLQRLVEDPVFRNFNEVIRFLMPSVSTMAKLPCHWNGAVISNYRNIIREGANQSALDDLHVEQERFLEMGLNNHRLRPSITSQSEAFSIHKPSDDVRTTKLSSDAGSLISAVTGTSESVFEKPSNANASSQRKQTQGRQRKHNEVTPQELSDIEVSIFGLISEVFDLSSQSWLRKNIISLSRTFIKIILTQSTIKTAVDYYRKATTPEKVSSLVKWFRDLFWPNDVFTVPDAIDPPEQDQWDQRQQLLKEMQAKFPVALAGVIGRNSSRRGIKKLHEFMQYPVLLKSLTMTVLDCLLKETFGNLEVYGAHLQLSEKEKTNVNVSTQPKQDTNESGWNYGSFYQKLKSSLPSWPMRSRGHSLKEILTHLPGAGPTSECSGYSFLEDSEISEQESKTATEDERKETWSSTSPKREQLPNVYQRMSSRVQSFFEKKQD